jgi:hypothetical protein
MLFLHILLIFKMARSNDPIFGEKPKKNGLGYFIILLLCALIGYWFFGRPTHQSIIKTNQEKAVAHLLSIQKALAKWKRGDYDGNGRKDLPVGELSLLHDTTFVNGRQIKLISKELCLADLRVKTPIALDGYLFALVHLDKKWPAGGEVFQLGILARPEDPGRTGACFFYVHSDGIEAYFSAYLLSDYVPLWPTARQLEAGIWKPLSLEDLKLGD